MLKRILAAFTLASCGVATPSSSLSHGSHEIQIVTTNQMVRVVAEQVAKEALDRSDEVLCGGEPLTLHLVDIGRHASPLADAPTPDQTMPSDIAAHPNLPFVLHGFDEKSQDWPLEKLVAVNSTMQHEIGHHILALRYPQTTRNLSRYGSDLPDWIDEMAGMLQDNEAERSLRQHHFTSLFARSEIIAPSSLLSIYRGKNPLSLKTSRPDGTLELIKTDEDIPTMKPVIAVEDLAIQDYYSQLDMLLRYLTATHGERCLLSSLINFDYSINKDDLRLEVDGISAPTPDLDPFRFDMTYRPWLLAHLNEGGADNDGR